MIERNELHMLRIAAKTILQTEKKRWAYIAGTHKTIENESNHTFYTYAKPYGEKIKSYEKIIETSNNITELKSVFDEILLLKGYCDAHILIDRIETEQMSQKRGTCMKSKNEYKEQCKKTIDTLTQLNAEQTKTLNHITETLQTLVSDIPTKTTYDANLRCPDEYEWFDNLDDKNTEMCYDEWDKVCAVLQTYEEITNKIINIKTVMEKILPCDF